MGNCCSTPEPAPEKEYGPATSKEMPKNSEMQAVWAANWAWIKKDDQELFTDVECIGLER